MEEREEELRKQELVMKMMMTLVFGLVGFAAVSV
jgi:hypothetical protein